MTTFTEKLLNVCNNTNKILEKSKIYKRLTKNSTNNNTAHIYLLIVYKQYHVHFPLLVLFDQVVPE